VLSRRAPQTEVPGYVTGGAAAAERA